MLLAPTKQGTCGAFSMSTPKGPGSCSCEYRVSLGPMTTAWDVYTQADAHTGDKMEFPLQVADTPCVVHVDDEDGRIYAVVTQDELGRPRRLSITRELLTAIKVHAAIAVAAQEPVFKE